MLSTFYTKIIFNSTRSQIFHVLVSPLHRPDFVYNFSHCCIMTMYRPHCHSDCKIVM